MVFEHQLAPGQWIDELALARDWHISRTPLREALKVLAAEGLVTPVPRQGCKVTEISESSENEITPSSRHNVGENARAVQPIAM